MSVEGITSRDIKDALTSAGITVYTAQKRRKMVGGQRYDFHGGLRQGNCVGTPKYFYRVTAEGDADRIVSVLREKGFDASYELYSGNGICVYGKLPEAEVRSTHRYDAVNPLVNPVREGDRIIAASGDTYIVKQRMNGNYWLEHSNGRYQFAAVTGQVAICHQIDQLASF